MLLTVVLKLYKLIVLLEYFGLCIANLIGQASQPCCNSLTLTICLMLASYYAKNYAVEYMACMGQLEKCYQEYLSQ